MPTAILAEDEPILLAQLKAKLNKLWPELEILAAAGDGESALEAIAEHQPDFALLDIQMPEMTGIEVAKHLAQHRGNVPLKTHIIFVTAYDQYAVEAFEAGAIDYVLKPYTDERLGATVQRLQERLGAQPPKPAQDLDTLFQRLASKLGAGTEQLTWIKATIGNQLRLIPVDEVLYFQSDEKYTCVMTLEYEALIKTPIKELLDGLDPAKFWQIHRSTIVAARAIEAVTRDFRGQAQVKVKGRKELLTVSRPFSHLFKQM
jgi:DNA-binding LytR/AlgR family response regulator